MPDVKKYEPERQKSIGNWRRGADWPRDYRGAYVDKVAIEKSGRRSYCTGVPTSRMRFIMTALAEKIYNEALNLPAEDRLSLLDKLLHSSNLATQADIDQAWIKEAERRDRQIDEGTAVLIPGEEVFAKINARLA